LQALKPHFGGVIRDLDLSAVEYSKELIQKLKDDLVQYRVLLFKGQHNLTGQQQVDLSQKLGTVESTFYKHPKSPHPDIFRVSNDEREGCTGVGRTGWHVDGTFMFAPFKYQTMHFPQVCKGGNTAFVPLKELYETQDEVTKEKWNKLWMITGRHQANHPLVYQHPYRKDTTMLFHCGEPFCEGWAEDDNVMPTSERKPVKMNQPKETRLQLWAACDKAVADGLGIEMEWEADDFSINDNIGLAHYAVPGTQNNKKTAGLRILHRTTIAGEIRPRKEDGRESFMM